jgi:hypothetical protein
MTPSVISTYDICVYFQKGDIIILPDDHIKIILHKFFQDYNEGYLMKTLNRNEKIVLNNILIIML